MVKSLCAIMCAICLGLGVASFTYLRAEDAAPTTKPADAKAADAKPVNTKCPVSGEDIDPTNTIVYKGKTIAFCCADCVKKFNQDPDTYVAKMK